MTNPYQQPNHHDNPSTRARWRLYRSWWRTPPWALLPWVLRTHEIDCLATCRVFPTCDPDRNTQILRLSPWSWMLYQPRLEATSHPASCQTAWTSSSRTGLVMSLVSSPAKSIRLHLEWCSPPKFLSTTIQVLEYWLYVYIFEYISLSVISLSSASISTYIHSQYMKYSLCKIRVR